MDQARIIPAAAGRGNTRERTDFFDRPVEADLSATYGFAGGAIERRAEARTEESVAAALADPNARVLIFRGDQAAINGGTAYFTRAQALAAGASAADIVLLGYDDKMPVLAATVPAEISEVAGATLRDLRGIAVEGLVAGRELGALALGRSLTQWHLRHGFCANCSASTRIANGGFRRDCRSCGAQHFPRTDPVAIMLAVRGDQCVLGRSPRFPAAFFSCLAGFIEPGETIEAAVRRETGEEAGIAIGRVRYFASQPWPFPSSLMIGCHAEALTVDIHPDEAELTDCRWFSRAEVRSMIAGTHKDGLFIPPPFAIAHQLIKAWADYD
jgi:NAD+ diphosphatase